MEMIYLTIVLAPLVGAIIAGLFRNQVGRSGAHWVTILGWRCPACCRCTS